MNIYPLALVAILSRRLVFPDYLLTKRDFLGFCPRVVEENIPAGEEMNVVMTGVSPLGTVGVMFP